MELLNDDDLRSPTWTKLRKHFEERLTDHRLNNDRKQIGDEDTAYLRGRIAEAKYLLSLAERDGPKPPG